MNAGFYSDAGEAGVEKREYVLSHKRSRRWVIAVGLLFTAEVGLGIWLFCLSRNLTVWLPFVAQAFGGTLLALTPAQAGRLAVSDDGLYYAKRRGIGYTLRWDSISSVRVHEHSDASRLWSAIIEDSQGHVVRIPRTCPDSAEIVDIVKKQVPETVCPDVVRMPGRWT